MTVDELQKVIDYMNSTLTKHTESVYNEDTGNYDIYPTAYFNEMLQVLSEYPVEESKECSMPNYETMYNDMVTKVESQKAEIKYLKEERRVLEHKLACAKGAIAMVEVIYGRKWAPSNLELIR